MTVKGEQEWDIVAGASLTTLMHLVTWQGAHSLFLGMLRQQKVIIVIISFKMYNTKLKIVLPS